jgi:RNA polymerase sigma-70 factor (ECF subfamily)
MLRIFPSNNLEIVGNKDERSAVLSDKGQAVREHEVNNRLKFEEVTLPHITAAYNLARWLTRNDHDAQDVVQEAYLRALKFFGGFRGGDGRAWLLKIVRNTCYTWLQRNRNGSTAVLSEDEIEHVESAVPHPEALFLKKVNRELLHSAIEELPLEFREVLILRELEELSYKQIADVVEIPIGTVMSRLARARIRLQERLKGCLSPEV